MSGEGDPERDTEGAVGQLVRRIDRALYESGLRGKSVRQRAWAVADALTETDDEPDGGWLVVRGSVYRVVEADQVGEDDGYRGWTVLVLADDPTDEEDPE